MASFKFMGALCALSLGISACASAPPAPSDSVSGEAVITADIGPDGKAIYKDKDGNAVDNPPAEAALLGALLEDMNRGGGALEDDDIWRKETGADLRHIQSGAICPADWGSFARTNNVVFKRNGQDVGCGYESADLFTVVTFYFYRNNQPVETEFREVMDIISTRIPSASASDMLVMSAPSSGFEYLADAVVYTNAKGARVKTGALLTATDGWRIKMRATYPASAEEQIETIVGTMLLAQTDQVRAGGVAPVTPDVQMPTDPDA